MFDCPVFPTSGSTSCGRYGRAAAGLAVALLCLALLSVITLVPRPALAASHVIYVDHRATGANNGSSWADAYTDLQVALQAATSGQEIWVAAGTYKPTTGSDRTATFNLLDGVALYGGFFGNETQRDQRDWQTHETILSGDLNGDDNGNVIDSEPTRQDNSYHVVSGSAINNTTILDGFTITGGNGNGSFDNRVGGGMYNVNNSSPILRNVTFSGSSADAAGGGMYNSGSNPTLVNVTFRSNSAQYGGGMVNYSSSPTLVNVTFSGNSASSNGGGMSNSDGSPTLINVTFSGNSAYWGGGMSDGDGSPTLINVTFSGNSASSNGGGMYNFSSSPILNNSILWGNRDQNGTGQSAQIYNDSSTASVSYSLVQGGVYPGIGNITGDPLFVDPVDPADAPTTGGDLRLRPDSPALDAGSNDSVPADTLDLDGDSDTSEPLPYDLAGSQRFADYPYAGATAGAIVDLGAYERHAVDVRVTKSVHPAGVLPGEVVTYTVQVTNAGSLPAAGVTLTDSLPAILTGVTISPTGVMTGPTGNNPYSWTIGELAPGSGRTITYRATVPQGIPGGTRYTEGTTARTTSQDVALGNNEDMATLVVRNAPPQSRDDGTTTAEETPVTLAVLNNDQDVNHDPLTISGVGRPLHGTVAIDGAQLHYTPTLDFTGTDRFTYTVSDGSLTDQAEVTIEITNINDPPVGRDTILAIAENSAQGSMVGLIQASDGDEDPLTYRLSDGNAAGAFALDPNSGHLTVATPAVLDYEATPAYTLTVAISDGVLSDTATLRVEVQDVNEAPVALADRYTLPEDDTLTVAVGEGVLQNDSDPEQDPLTATLEAAPLHGEVTLHPDGTFTYTPQPGFVGTDRFDYVVSDGEWSDSTIVMLTVGEVNDAPLARDATFTLREDSATGTVVGTLTASDPDGDALTFALIDGNEGERFTIDPATGELRVADGSQLDYETTRSYTLTVEASDGTFADIATLTLHVLDVNEAPRVADMTFALPEGSATGGVVGTVPATDPERDPLTFTLLAGNDQGVFAIDPSTGVVRVADGSQLDYATTPSYRLTVEVSDGVLSDTATITIEIVEADEETGEPEPTLFLPLLLR